MPLHSSLVLFRKIGCPIFVLAQVATTYSRVVFEDASAGVNNGCSSGITVNGMCMSCPDNDFSSFGQTCVCADGSACLQEATTVTAPAPADEDPDSQAGGNGLCKQNGLAGSYQPVDFLDDTEVAQVETSAKLAAAQYWETADQSCWQTVLDACKADPASVINDLQVTSSCSQVVAGTNYKIEFQTTIPCATADSDKVDSQQLQQTLQATVFYPLPGAGEPSVESVELTSGACTGLRGSVEATTPSTEAMAPSDSVAPSPPEKPTASAGSFSEIAAIAALAAIALA